MRDENISVPDFLSKEQAQKRLDRDVAREKLRNEVIELCDKNETLLTKDIIMAIKEAELLVTYQFVREASKWVKSNVIK